MKMKWTKEHLWWLSLGIDQATRLHAPQIWQARWMPFEFIKEAVRFGDIDEEEGEIAELRIKHLNPLYGRATKKIAENLRNGPQGSAPVGCNKTDLALLLGCIKHSEDPLSQKGLEELYGRMFGPKGVDLIQDCFAEAAAKAGYMPPAYKQWRSPWKTKDVKWSGGVYTGDLFDSEMEERDFAKEIVESVLQWAKRRYNGAVKIRRSVSRSGGITVKITEFPCTVDNDYKRAWKRRNPHLPFFEAPLRARSDYTLEATTIIKRIEWEYRRRNRRRGTPGDFAGIPGQKYFFDYLNIYFDQALIDRDKAETIAERERRNESCLLPAARPSWTKGAGKVTPPPAAKKPAPPKRTPAPSRKKAKTSTTGEKPNPRAAAKLRVAAEKLRSKSQADLDTPRETNTRRRLSFAMAAQEKARRGLGRAKAMNAVANLMEAGKAGCLQGMTTAKVYEDMQTLSRMAWEKYLYEEFGYSGKEMRKHEPPTVEGLKFGTPRVYPSKEENSHFYPAYKRLQKAGITKAKAAQCVIAYTKVQGNIKETKQERTKRRIQEVRSGSKIPGYFPTPDVLINRMIDGLEKKGMNPRIHTVYEPSAGDGAIGRALRKRNYEVVVSEKNHTLRKLLKEQDFKVVADDTLSHYGEHEFVLMNPPFEKGMDIKHVTHVFKNNLRSAGKMFAIVSAGAIENDKPASKVFNELIKKHGMKKDIGTPFKKAAVKTGVRVYMVYLEKPAIG